MSEYETRGGSRRSFMAKGVLAASALALGASAFGTATVSAQRAQTAVFSNNYYPGASFEVIAPLQTNTTVDRLRAEGETVPEIAQSNEWTGHIIRYDEAGITTFLFTRGQRLNADENGTMGDDASMFSSQLNLLATMVE